MSSTEIWEMDPNNMLLLQWMLKFSLSFNIRSCLMKTDAGTILNFFVLNRQVSVDCFFVKLTIKKNNCVTLVLS